MICFFHRVDLDGQCSAAIIHQQYPECRLYGYNYGDPFPWDQITVGERVFMVDVSLPIQDMIRLSKRSDLIYIDHHKSMMDDMAEHNVFFSGCQRQNIGACALVWDYISPLPVSVPHAVELLADFDIWDHTDPDVMPFQMGMRIQDTEPDAPVWRDLLTDTSSTVMRSIIEDGKIILKYETQNNAYYAKAAVFPMIFEGQRCLAINKLFAGSSFFESVWDDKKYDMMLAFGYVDGHWKIGLRSAEKDVLWIAKKYGGGGHPRACGFECDQLPFKLKKEVRCDIPNR